MLRLKWVLIPITIVLIASTFPGCEDENKDSAIDVRIEDRFGIDFSRPEYLENQNDLPPMISQEIETWTPTAKEVAELFDQGDQEGALRLLYQDILETNPQKEDQLLFSIFVDPWLYLFHDPELVFRLYRDNDRTELSEDEKAACDMMVALTYDMGDFSGAREETLYPEGTEEQRARYVEYLEEKNKLAFEMYKKITDRYPDSNVGVLAKLALAQFYLSDKDEKGLLKLKDEIVREHPDSVYQTRSAMYTAAFYYNEADIKEFSEEEEGYVKKTLQLYESIMQLPNILYASTSSESASAHDNAERRIKQLRSRIERRGWSMPEQEED